MKFVCDDILDYCVKNLVGNIIVSGNPALNMSGGVNGALLLKYGASLQLELHNHLKKIGPKNVTPGFCYKFGQPIAHYKNVIYTVAVDVWYNSSIDIVKTAILNAVSSMDLHGYENIALPALATGYGKLSKRELGIALARVENLIQHELILIEINEVGFFDIIKGYTYAHYKPPRQQNDSRRI